MTQRWWLYLLMCRDGRTYAGIAIDIAARYAAHVSGKGAKFTRSNPPVRVLGVEAFATKSEALKAEAALRKLARPKRLEWALSRIPVTSMSTAAGEPCIEPSPVSRDASA